ncbi:MAG: type III PLP-dependent enzyme [Actinomycetota bacterium]|nr:type III PLP-dependent enzyme [Actinomycetota bacterium]
MQPRALRPAAAFPGADLPTPCLVLELDVVAERYTQLRESLPEAVVHYAVKANPHPELVRLLARLGASFDVASPAEIDLCLGLGVPPDRVSYGNTVKKRTDIAHAWSRGIRLFAFDSHEELHKLARAAPGASVFCRLLTSGTGADWPLSRKFGCAPDMAADLLLEADELGLDACGLSFHVGSQQRDPSRWDPAVGCAAAVARAVQERSRGRVVPWLLNVGGGLPARYLEQIPALGEHTGALTAALDRHFPAAGPLPRPQVMAEPGRYLVADAGVVHTEVVLVASKSYADPERWVYLDTGVFGGLAETLGEAIKYRLVTSRDGGPTGPVVLAGPTCDSVDVLYEQHRYQLPLALTAGDRLLLLSAGAYTSAYCTDGFNGFSPMPVHCLPPSAPSVRVGDQEAGELPDVLRAGLPGALGAEQGRAGP